MLSRMQRLHPAYCWWSRNGKLVIKIAKIILAILAWLAINNFIGLCGGITD